MSQFVTPPHLITSIIPSIPHTQTLSSDADKREQIFDAFIDKYKIDMSIFLNKTYSEYSSVNEWFIRRLAPGVRPVAFANDADVFLNPADSRVMVFESVPSDQVDGDVKSQYATPLCVAVVSAHASRTRLFALSLSPSLALSLTHTLLIVYYTSQRIWIKGENFTPRGMIGTAPARGLVPAFDANIFDGGSMLIWRLAPQDYHRYHAPFDGKIMYQYFLDGTLHSVNADGMTSQNYAIYNRRRVVIMKPDNPKFGDVRVAVFMCDSCSVDI
jgi:phosphatidylserine decarboxylase